MKKFLLHGEIRNKFTIQSKKTGMNVMETPGNNGDGFLYFTRYPAVFNSESDANRYLDGFDVTEEERNSLIIASHSISFFNNGAVLVEFED